MKIKMYFQTIRTSLVLLFCLSILLLQGCVDSHILQYREGLSRTWIYMDFSRNNHPYETISIVGGEHMIFYKILGFENDKFSVTVETLEGKVFWGVSGDGICIESIPGIEEVKKRVKVDAMEAIFSVDISAHPYGRYKLRVEKLPTEKK